MAELKLIQGTAALDKAIASIKNRGAKLDNDIQNVGLSVMAHTAAHGDTSVMDRLVNAMPKSARKLALIEWMLAFGCARLLKKEDAEEALRMKEGAVFKFDKTRKLNLEGAQAKKWHEFKPEAAVATAFDAQAAVSNLLARMRSAAAKGMTVEHKAEALADAEALVLMLRG